MKFHLAIRLNCAIPTWLAAALFVLCCGWSLVLQAGSGGIDYLPVPPKAVKHSLKLEIDSTGIDASGYRPVKVTALIWPPAAAPAERTLRVEIHGITPGGLRNYGQVATDFLEIPVGAKTASVTVLVPQMEMWQQLGVQVFEDGERLDELSTMLGLNRPGWSYAHHTPGILFLDKDVPLPAARERILSDYKRRGIAGEDTYDLPDFRMLVDRLPEMGYYNANVNQGYSENKPIRDLQLLDLANAQSWMRLAGLAEMPEQWLELSCYDIIITSHEDLLALANNHPQSMQALRDWLATGPLLCVTNVAADAEKLPELEKLLQLRSLPPADDHPERLGWNVPPDNVRRGAINTPSNRNNYNPPYADMEEDFPAGGKPKNNRKYNDDPPFLMREADLGMVVAIPHELSGQDRPFTDWSLILNAIPPANWLWVQRQGIGVGTNPWYWEFLIPGVGMAPVFSFVVLITLFMLAIGPINYWFVRKVQRNYLLLITVPAGALIVTLGLFLYALGTEGLHSNARVRSFTRLNSERQIATSISRHSYYASLTPSSGLLFPRDCTAFPLEPERDEYYNQKLRKLGWEDEGQRLKTGYLFPRTVSQFVVTRPTPSSANLVVKGDKQSSHNRQAQNHLGCRIEKLMVCDDGLLLTAASIEPDAQANLRVAATTDLGDWQSLFQENEPVQLFDYTPNSNHNLLVMMFGGGYYYGNNSGIDSDKTVLETNMRAVSTGDALKKLPPGQFVAVVSRPSEVTLGIEGAREVACFHVIQGDW